jgi:nitrate/nitrite transporter NarK
VVVCGLAQLLVAPPPGYTPVGQAPKAVPAAGAAQKKEDYSPKEMLGTWQFWALWFMYACGAGAGLMVISVAKKIVAAEATEAIAVAAVMGLAVGNGAGRVIAGTASDKLGRKLTLFLFLACQAVLLALLTQAKGDSPLASSAALMIITALVGANYGSNLALFPSVTKDYFGLKNFGMNYGLVFTAWGVGGFVLAKIAGMVFDKTGSFNFAYILAAVLLVAAAIVTFLIKAPRTQESPVSASNAQASPEPAK